MRPGSPLPVLGFQTDRSRWRLWYGRFGRRGALRPVLFHSSESTSTNAALAPANRTACAGLGQVSAGHRTSSPGPTCKTFVASWSAAVPLDTAMACRRPTRAATADSKRSTSSPWTSCPDSSTAATARCSSSPIQGFARRIKAPSSYQPCFEKLQIAGSPPSAHAIAVDLAEQLDALERALTRLGVRLLEEELPDEAHIDGGLCTVKDERVLYLRPDAPPWRRAEVLLGALRRLPHDQIWLPPEIRAALESPESCRVADPLLG